jgi:ABC-type lipoprotein release transport system permease subunit
LQENSFFCQQACTSKQLFAKDPQEHQNKFPNNLQEHDSKKLFAKDPQEHQNSFFQQFARTRQQKTVFLQVLVKGVLTGTCKNIFFCQQACTSKQLFAKDPQ